MPKLTGKVALITGGGRGLGRAYALACAKESAKVVINDIDQEAEAVVREILALGAQAVSCIAAVGNKDTAEKLVLTADKAFGRLDILVNNAGIPEAVVPMIDLDELAWDESLRVHLKGTFLNCQAASKYMIAHQIQGKIINITSQAGIFGGRGRSAYSAAKAGILGFTYAISRELAPYRICVNAVAPLADTRRLDAVPAPIKDAMMAKWASESSIGRLGSPEDVAPVIVFLASDESSYVSGQCVIVSGSVGTL